MRAALVIMAAGMGSRYGGSKQVDGIGPNGEILLEYSVYDALRAGFTKVVFVIKPEMRAQMEELCGRRIAGMRTKDGKPVEVCYAYQDLTCVPDFYRVPPERVKPFGTGHAALCAREFVDEPFALINADDYYGADAFRVLYEKLCALPPRGEAAMVGYRLDHTVSEHGTVTRGLCRTAGGYLEGIHETYELAVTPDGMIRSGDGTLYPPDNPVSMNFWGFTPWLFEELDAYFRDFLRSLAPGELKAECQLPGLIALLLERGELKVTVLHSEARWFGMTYREDREAVVKALRKLHEDGVYPPTLH